MNVEEKHLQTLSKHKHIFDLYEKTNELVNFYHDIQKEIVDVYKVYHPYYHYNNNCLSCVVEMINTIYWWYNQIINQNQNK